MDSTDVLIAMDRANILSSVFESLFGDATAPHHGAVNQTQILIRIEDAISDLYQGLGNDYHKAIDDEINC